MRAHEDEARKRDQLRTVLLALVVAAVILWGVVQGSLLLAVLGGGVVGGLAYAVDDETLLPRVVEADVDRERADRLFELVDGTTTRGDDAGEPGR